jgi:cell fate (sporulation/competence/biofilm development) regulator YlbF (YheA/YmcA/DUF963 family)
MNNLEQKIGEFSRAIRETKECQAFQKAAQAYGNDKAAQKLMNDFTMAQQELAILEGGNFSGQEAQKEKYEALLKEVRANGPINELVESRKKMEILVGDLAVTLSNAIDFPFNLPPKKGCGCSG